MNRLARLLLRTSGLDKGQHSSDAPDLPAGGQDGVGMAALPVPDAELRRRVIAALRGVHDPEIPVNIYDLGLIYDLELAPGGRVGIRMTLTAPGCPVARTFPTQVATAVQAVDGVSHADVELVWDPPWDPSRATEAARLQLGLHP